MDVRCSFCGRRLSQTRFHGVTGLVAFDENGFRKDFKLSVQELNLNQPVRKVYGCSLLRSVHAAKAVVPC